MIASVLRYLFGQEEVYKTSASYCIHTELVEEFENTIEHNSEALIYPHNISASIQPSVVDKALTIGEDQCNLVYTVITQSSLKTSCSFTPNKKGPDLISRIKQIYDECKCEECDCIAGTNVSYASLPRPDPPQPQPAKATCKCIPCDCLTCAKMPLLNQRSNEASTIENKDFSKDEDKFIWKESFFSSFERAVDACTCRPCDCVTCNKVKLEDKVKKEVETQTKSHYKTFNYKCRCNPCECLFCKALSGGPECKCAPCKCETCPNLFLTNRTIDVNSACVFNKPSPRECAPFVLPPKEKPKVSVKKIKTPEKLEIKKISLTRIIEYKENMPSFYQRIVGNTTVPEITECKQEMPNITALEEQFTETDNESECDCGTCYCVQCTKKKIDTANLSHSTSVTNDTLCKCHDEINTECTCETCECEVCNKGGGVCEDALCQCKDDKDQCTSDLICNSKNCNRKKIDLKCKNCKQCLNKNHHQCMNESCECEQCSDEPDCVFNADGRIFPFLKSETNLFAIPTISRSSFNVQNTSKAVLKALHAAFNKQTKIFNSTFNASDIGEEIYEIKRHTASSIRYVENLKLAYAKNEIDPFAQADVQEECDSNLKYYEEKGLHDKIVDPILHHSDECITQ